MLLLAYSGLKKERNNEWTGVDATKLNDAAIAGRSGFLAYRFRGTPNQNAEFCSIPDRDPAEPARSAGRPRIDRITGHSPRARYVPVPFGRSAAKPPRLADKVVDSPVPSGRADVHIFQLSRVLVDRGPHALPGTPDSGQAAKRDSLWVLDIGSSNRAARQCRRRHPIVRTRAGRLIRYFGVQD